MYKGLNASLLRFGIPLVLVTFLFFLSRTQVFLNSPTHLSFGILLDLLITLPFVYFLLIRKTKVPKISILYIFILGILVAGLIIPLDQQELLSQIKYIAIPAIEIFVLSLVIYKITKLGKSFQKAEGLDFYDKLLIATEEIFPGRIGKLLASEIAVFYYLLKRKAKDQKENEYSYYKKSGIVSVISVVLFLVIAETFVLHLLLERWNATVAWVLTLIGIYTILQIASILRSLKHRLISIDYEEQIVNLKYGFASQTSIPFQSIKSIEKSQRTPSSDKDHLSLSIFEMFDSKNASLHLHDEQKIQRMYGIERRYKSISIFLDELDTFAEAIEKIIESQDNSQASN